ncbi:MAG: DNA-protecting protein DprA [Polyangiaceae bacterium]|nr:DNA-protecting protein DprA [Polyangiaceae bacterium]
MLLTPSDTEYPDELRFLPALPNLRVSGPLQRGRRVAIVGSRNPVAGAAAFASDLAQALVKAGVTVVSGGALGIDAAAHEGAMKADGTTWVVAGTGCNRCYPPRHRKLFADIASSATSRMIWPFEDDVDASPQTFRKRNGILVALSEAVIVVQAHLRSGSRNAAAWARSLGRPLWVTPALPWPPYVGAFSGCAAELSRGARPLFSTEDLFRDLHLPFGIARPDACDPPRRKKVAPPAALCRAPIDPPLSAEERLVLSSLSLAPMHLDEILEIAPLRVSSAVTALLTLSMKDVVVEGPDGFYRRKPGM